MEIVWDILIFSLLGAVLSVLAVYITTLVPDVFVGVSMPVLLFYVVITLTNKHWKTEAYMPSCIYFRSGLFGGGICQFIYALLVTVCTIWVLYHGIFRQIKRRNGS